MHVMDYPLTKREDENAKLLPKKEDNGSRNKRSARGEHKSSKKSREHKSIRSRKHKSRIRDSSQKSHLMLTQIHTAIENNEGLENT
jgi:hypothetical protein